jgi:hypothetical protein
MGSTFSKGNRLSGVRAFMEKRRKDPLHTLIARACSEKKTSVTPVSGHSKKSRLKKYTFREVNITSVESVLSHNYQFTMHLRR